ncbi:hypothetical protein FQN54_006897 [Arachnomyces sp. PD_36]|nr:hypothetical protein FQN54_006897 [Arachnomyces sp. PD_36]
MPPKRTRSGTAAAPPAKEKKARQSKLAKQNDISGEEEAEIKEAFALFSVEDEDYADEKEGVIPTQDVRKALMYADTVTALGLPPKDPTELTSILSALDPTSSNLVPYEPFLSICAMKLHARTSDSISEEIESAYHLFTRGGEGPITISHLRKVARVLKEDVSDDLLRDMIREGNGGDRVQSGVSLEQFRDVMGRAGVF